MRRAMFVLLALSAVVLAPIISASAGIVLRMRANIPFAFYAGEELLPAGEYVFEMPTLGSNSVIGSNLTVHTQDGSISQYLHVFPGGMQRSEPAFNVTFNRYGDTYFLSKVQNRDYEANLPKTRSEIRMTVAHSKGFGIKPFRERIIASLRER